MASDYWAAWRLSWAAQPLICSAMLGLAILQGVFAPAAAALLGHLIDIFATGTTTDTGWALGLMGGLLVIAGTAAPAAQYLDRRLERASSMHTRDLLYAAITAEMDLTRLENPEYRDRLYLAEEASRTSPTSVFGGTIGLIRAAITLGGLIWTTAVVSAPAAAIVAVSILPQLIGELRLSRLRLQMLMEITPLDRRHLFYSDLLTDLTAAKELRLFGSASFFRRLMRQELGEVHRLEDTRDRGDLRSQSLLTLIASLLAVGALAVVVWQIKDGSAPVGALGVVVLTLFATPGAVVGAVQSVSQLHQASRLFGHFRAVTDAPALTDRTAIETSSPIAGPIRIVLDDVWFRYTEATPWVLRALSATIEARSTTALVGPNGSGKSTIIKLLCGFYRPTKGRILINGMDLEDVSPEQLRQATTAVFQDFMSYEMTLAENIAVGSLDGSTSLDHLALPDESAARAVGLNKKAATLPEGYHTQLSRIFARGDTPGSGALLSGGEWQRLAIARAISRGGRPLLLLDEPTSWLDASSTSWFGPALEQLGANATTLLITHRLGLAQRADHIIVIEDGTVIEAGTHRDLLQGGGTYSAMFTAQADEMLRQP